LYSCGHNRVHVCHYNGKHFQTLCIRRNSPLRTKPQHSSIEDYCGPCHDDNDDDSPKKKAFESAQELRDAVALYVNQDTYNAQLASKYGWPMNAWNVSLVSDFSDLFAHKTTFDSSEQLSGWDMSSATNLDRMFYQCTGCNPPNIGTRWNTERVTSMMGTFWHATNFNQPLTNWNTARVVDMSRIFCHAASFDQDLSQWQTFSVLDFSYAFMQATKYSHDLSQWDISSAITMERMLYKVKAYDASVFRQGALLSSWKHQFAPDLNRNELFASSRFFTTSQSNDGREEQQ